MPVVILIILLGLLSCPSFALSGRTQPSEQPDYPYHKRGNGGSSGGGDSILLKVYIPPEPLPKLPTDPLLFAPPPVDPAQERIRRQNVQHQIQRHKQKLMEERLEREKEKAEPERKQSTSFQPTDQQVTVQMVTSGNSFVDKKKRRFVLSGVDAPLYSANPRVPSEPGGEEAYIRLRDLIESKEVTVKEVGQKVEGQARIPVEVWLEGKSVNELFQGE